MGSPNRCSWTVLLALACVSAALADPKDFDVDAKPVFQGVTTSFGAVPMAVTIENKGPDARGQLVVGTGDDTTRYPIDLPRGSKKRIVTYPSPNPYGGGDLEFILDTDQGRIKIPMVATGSYSYGGSSLVAMIGETSGELGFLRQEERKNPNQQMQSYFDTYCKPEDAPDRPVGYETMGAVVLGEGSERLSDEAVKALKLYALSGGTLIFSGGASAPVLSDPRWASMLPATNFQTKTISGGGLAQYAGVAMNESYTIAAGTAVRSATPYRDSAGNLIAASRPLGLGKTVVFAFNMFEDPFVRWSGRKKLFLTLAKTADFNRATAFLSQFQSGGYDTGYSAYSSYSYSGGPPPGIATTGATSGGGMVYYGSSGWSERQDPFNVELPSPNRVFWILAGFFVTVVPLNFLILRKLKRGELAWVTAPVISLVFAGIFLNQASDLYSASLSTATNGLLIAQEGVPHAMFVGNTQMFFPNGGSYDLKLQNVDKLGNSGPGNGYYNPYERRTSTTELDPVDTGTVQVPDLRAANLAFEEISYRQVYDAERYLDAKQIGPGLYRITNVSRHTLSETSLAVRGNRIQLGTLEPGAHKDIELNFDDNSKMGEVDDPITAVTKRARTMAVIATISDLRPGPQIGAQVGRRSSVKLVYVMDEPKRGGFVR